MKKKSLIITLSIILAALIVAFGTVVVVQKIKAKDVSSEQEEKIEISVTVVYEDASEKEFEIATKAGNLGDALLEKGLVTEEEHKTGFYNYIDGVRADYTQDGAWWCITKDGEMTTVGANEQPIEDGDNFEITYTPA